MRKYVIILFLTCACMQMHAQVGIITTICGNDTAGYSGEGGPATKAKLNSPNGICLDKFGNLFIADAFNQVVREILAPTGIIITIAGVAGVTGFSGDGGIATNAELYVPEAVFTDTVGNVYIADAGNNRIRKITASTGIITTVAGSGGYGGVGTGGFGGDGGAATNAKLDQPSGLCVDNSGNIYIADYGNNRIRKINTTTGIITTVAGIGPTGYTGGGFIGYSGDGGPSVDAQFSGPIQVFVDRAENIFICDQFNNAVRKIDALTAVITTVVGTGATGYSGDGGPATNAQLNQPFGIYIDGQSNIFFVEIAAIKRVDALSGIITALAGNDTAGFSGDGGPATNAEIIGADIFLDKYGTIYLADYNNNRIRKIYNPKLSSPQISIAEKQISIYPNPTTGRIIIEDAKGSEVIMYDVVGNVMNKKVMASNKDEMNIEYLPNGMYVIQVVDENTRIRTMKKIVKE
jgi:hypothetical protein